MKWFSGSIAQAIAFAQTQKRVFVAYVEGSCEKSQAMSNVFLDKDVLAELEKASFVCVKLEANGIGYKQLVEVYRNVPIPSLFFISHDGRPLDIVEGSLYDDTQSLKSAYLEAAEYSTRMNSVPETSRPAPGDKLIEERRKQTSDILEGKRKLAEKKRPVASLKRDCPSDSRPDEQKQEVKKKLKDPLVKKMEEEMEKERQQEALARQRILDQIAEDKAARAAKFKKEPEPQPSSSANTSEKSPPPLSSEARIQFRLPTGESKFSTFQKDANLTDIRSYIEKNLKLPFRNYRLVMTFPRREFTSEDDSRTLEELNLLPSAVLLILPISADGGLVTQLTFFSVVTKMVQDLLKPLYSLSAYIRGWLTGPSEPRQDSSQPTPNSRSNQPPRTYVKKAGNIHSLKDLRDGNDENNTWNGNSTQQM